MPNKHAAILEWLANGETGISSEWMAWCAMGKTRQRTGHPHDPADFNRCLLLLKAAPEVRDSFPVIAASCPEWAAIIAHWDELQELFVGEVGWNWGTGDRASKTYDRMRHLIDCARQDKENSNE